MRFSQTWKSVRKPSSLNQGPGEGQERPRRKAKNRLMAEMQGRETDGNNGKKHIQRRLKTA